MSESSARTEVREYLESKTVRRRLFPRAALVGIAAGALAVAFRIGIQLAEIGRSHLVAVLPSSWFLRFAVVALVATIGTWLAMLIGRLDPDAGGSGIPHMKGVLEGHTSMNWSRILWVKFVGALSALGCGLVLGREGPTVQIGGATGLGVAQVTGSTLREQRALMASGAGAGLAAAFNAPLAGVTFVLEELQRDFQPVVFGAALLCAAVATVISRLANGQFPVLTVPPIATPSLVYLPIFAVIGLGGGLLGVAFNRCLLAAINLVSRWRAKSALAVAAGLGILIAAAWSVSPILIGGGHAVTESALQGEIALAPVLLYLLIRFTLLHASYATGVPGGIFAPLLSMGALAGVGLFTLTAHLIPIPGLLLAACGVAGMCAMFSGVVRAPLTGIILIGEMTGSYGMLLPLLVAAFTAYAVAEAFGDTPIYEALLQRDSAIRGWLTEGDDPVTAEFEVKSGSEFEGKKLRDLGLPAGVVIIVCREGGREIVPNADTVLTNHMRIVVAASSTLKLGAVEAGVR